MTEAPVIVAAPKLERFATAILLNAGLPAEDAAYCAHCLVQTNLWGVDSHGVLRLPIYAQRVRSRAINRSPNITAARSALGLEIIDGDDGMGFLVGRKAMARAIQLAREYSVGVVGAARSNHFGAAALYARMAADAGMIGIAMTNVRPNMVAPGGSEPITGNNPIAIAIPTFGVFPFVLDISLSNVAGGKLLLAAKQGDKIPLDWATDREGRPTDDPEQAFAGFLLPVGGHKGLALSYVVDILCGVLTSGIFQYNLGSMYGQPEQPSLTGHMMIAINPLAVMDEEELTASMAEFMGNIKASPMWDESREMLIPGEPEYRMEQLRRRDGIPLSPQLYEELTNLGEELGVAW
jgi:LDH2 family malate/lactate/ureidoglycolate dehydrogenase